MAEEKRFLKGLFKDTGHIDQMQGSWRHALNMIMNEKEGSLSNEGGTEYAGRLGLSSSVALTLGQTSTVIGAIEVSDDNVILFICDTSGNNVHRIVMFKGGTGAFEKLYEPTTSNAQLNFSVNHPIEGTFKIDSKGDLIVYWTDDLNPPRAFNVTRQQRVVPTLSQRFKLYGINPNTSHKHHIDLLNLFPNAGPVPHIELDDIFSGVAKPYQNSIIEGGGLRTAVYYLALAYVDEDLVSTNYLTVSNPVSIVDEYDHTRPTNKKDGAKDGTQTSKAIKWRVSNLNTDYTRLQPTIIRKMGDEIKAIKLNAVEINMNSAPTPWQGVVFSGVEGAEAGDLDKVIIDTVGYDTAKTMNQLDGVLYLGNTTGTKDVGFQKYANNIKLSSVTHEIPDFDEFYATVDNFETGFGGRVVDKFAGSVQYVDQSKSYRYIPNIYKYKGYMRDEVYAFYISFIMRDGSMSYAYHIPGRDVVANELDVPAGFATASDFRELSKGYAKNFHFFEYSFTGGSFAGLETRGMNYWQNATEFYPKTGDFEVWDSTNGGQKIGDLGENHVQHHKFPSNENESKQSIDTTGGLHNGHNCITRASEGLPPSTNTAWVGTLVMRDRGHEMSGGQGITTSAWIVCDMTEGFSTNDPAMEAALCNFSSNRFVADQDMSVTVHYVHILRQMSTTNPDVTTRLEASVNGVTQTNCSNSSGFSTWSGCAINGFSDSRISWNGSQDSGCGGSGVTYNLKKNDWIRLRSKRGSNSGSTPRTAGYGQVSSGCIDTQSTGPPNGINATFMYFDIISDSAKIPEAVYNDAKISHDVKRLGFTLDDIQIPKGIADKVQGFRLYYAKRKHSDRTILGQAPILPMRPLNAPMGICKEASGSKDAAQVLSTLQTEGENFYSKDPWPLPEWHYATPDFMMADGGGSGSGTWHTGSTYTEAHTHFSFHDFYLLRTKNSLAGATHFKHQYRVRNLAWNGPSVDQDKRMQTKLVKDTNTSPQILVPKEVWGWDENINCYPQKINSAILIGVDYKSGYRNIITGTANGSYKWPRLLGQKSKSYLKGDSIFNGKSLGFGGKIFNEFGESCIVLALKDNHGYRAYDNYNRGGWNTVLSTPIYSGWTGTITTTADVAYPYSAGENRWGDYGHNTAISGALLINSVDDTDGTLAGNRSSISIENLMAFKTDVYKSIDSQELIWTGFEVLGDDLDNFIFNDDGTPFTNTHNGETADYSVATLQGANWQQQEDINTGIYGGDTYLCRYGIVTSLKSNNNTEFSNPKKGIHYQIVESTDNISFRHIESDKSLYFPGTPAKDLVRNAGIIDFTDQENVKYNKNYSELNDMRVAFPLPLSETKQSDFPTRVHRSAKNDTSSLIDNYRLFLANQFKDLPKNRGDLWKLASFNNLIYFHMEESLLKSQGKQSMQMKDGSEAYVGSGDIFKQEPEEIVLTDDGYGGTTSQWSVLTTRFGYFFVDLNAKKVFLMKDKLTELSDLGMKKWFRENLTFKLKPYGLNPIDNPIVGFGAHSVWDPKHKRIILTYRDIAPTQALITGLAISPPGDGAIAYNESIGNFQIWECKNFPCDGWTTLEWTNSHYFTPSGWTISYYPELNVWVSLHSYVPYIYFNTSTNFYSLTDQHPILTSAADGYAAGSQFGNATIWKHNSDVRGIIYQTSNGALYEPALIYYPFEIEYIHNDLRNVTSLYSSFAYTMDVFNPDGVRVLDHGFTSYFLYNTFQISGSEISNPLEYLINIRRVGNNWKVNNFRDMAGLQLDTSGYYMSTNLNVVNKLNTGTITSSSTNKMFIKTGVVEYPNPAYLDFNKPWTAQKKFIDKWIGIRLIYDNISNNLLNLYSTTVESRNMIR